MYRNFFALSKSILITFFAFSLAFCDKDDDEEKVDFTITGSADGAQEVPAVTTNGSGTAAGTYNKNTNLFNYTVTWKDLSGPATNMHFHGPADPGTSAGVALGITGFASAVAGSLTSSATLTEAQEAELLGGKWYYNVHTALNPGGEVRGQLSAD